MPIVLGLAVAALAGFALLGGRPPGTKTVAFLELGPALNVVWDGLRWRPMGTVDLATVEAWKATGHDKARINGADLTWTGMGFS